MENKYTFVVGAYYHSSEATYYFGPFFTEESAVKFFNQMVASNKCEEPTIMAINNPVWFGTGKEVAAQ